VTPGVGTFRCQSGANFGFSSTERHVKCLKLFVRRLSSEVEQRFCKPYTAVRPVLSNARTSGITGFFSTHYGRAYWIVSGRPSRSVDNFVDSLQGRAGPHARARKLCVMRTPSGANSVSWWQALGRILSSAVP
jgi:hypothetical protein